LPPVRILGESKEQEIINFSRANYATPRSVVEIKIAKDTEDDGEIPENREQSNRTLELYDTVCQSCNKKMKVPFKPDGKRPVYCKSCLKKMESTPNNYKKPNNFKPRESFEEAKTHERDNYSNNKTAEPRTSYQHLEVNREVKKAEIQVLENDEQDLVVVPKENNVPAIRNEVSVNLEETAKKFIPEEKIIQKEEIPVRESIVEDSVKLETKSGKKIDFEGLLDIIKKENKSSQDNPEKGEVIKPGETVKFD
jgi:CxxC-x17-CxxC domain-containing protein